MNAIIIIITKLISKILNLLNRGSSFPGYIALKLNKNIKYYFKPPKTTIFVTGTNGKSSISAMLTNIYTQNGLKVGNNSNGSNLENGILTCLIQNSNIFGKLKVDILVLEIDERYFKKISKFLKPNYLIINNISRDQPPRNGHFDIVFNDISNHITKDMHLILNSDDPIITKFGLNHQGKTTYYGLEKTKNSYLENKNILFDLIYCPKCNTRLIFNYFHFGNIGNYKCPKCDFKRPTPNYEAKLINDYSFKIKDEIIKMENKAFYNVYNLLVSYGTARLTGLTKKQTVNSLNKIIINVDRIKTYQLDDKLFTILISKNENCASYNQSLNYINKQNKKITIVIGFTNISRRYTHRDLSWLWDINFESLNKDLIQEIICVGPFAYDIATRLKYANFNEEQIIICKDSKKLLNYVKNSKQKHIYSLICFQLEIILKKQLKELQK